MSTLIKLDHVTFAYDGAPVLRDVSWAIEPGEFTGIVGPSGSGKTSLLRLLLEFERPQSGTVRRAANLTTSYVPQLETVNWNFPLTVFECVLMARVTKRLVPWATKQERDDVHNTLARLGIAELARRHIRELSGGQQQRMFLARALVRSPDLLLLDEPTSGVDVATRHEVLHLLEDLNREGIAVVLTTHDLNGMAAHLPHLLCLNQSVIAAGAPHEVIVPSVLEQTFGAQLDVLEHLGMLVVVDRQPADQRAVAR
jgi:ABC-type Mn2+/Zn2+ transport system ATPase subunit